MIATAVHFIFIRPFLLHKSAKDFAFLSFSLKFGIANEKMFERDWFFQAAYFSGTNRFPSLTAIRLSLPPPEKEAGQRRGIFKRGVTFRRDLRWGIFWRMGYLQAGSGGFQKISRGGAPQAWRDFLGGGRRLTSGGLQN